MRVRAREILTPTQDRIIQEDTLPKLEFLTNVIHDITDLEYADERMPQFSTQHNCPLFINADHGPPDIPPLHSVLLQ